MARDNIFELRIVSPDGMFYGGESDFVEFTTVEGRMGVYRNHVPLTAILEPCVIRIHNGGEVTEAEISGGFARILKESVTVLAEDAEWK